MAAGIYFKLERLILRPVLCLILLICTRLSSATHVSSGSLGAVSSESKICSEIGIELLKRAVSLDLHINVAL
jgi:hypothetical protein